MPTRSTVHSSLASTRSAARPPVQREEFTLSSTRCELSAVRPGVGASTLSTQPASSAWNPTRRKATLLGTSGTLTMALTS